MNGGKILDKIEISLLDRATRDTVSLVIDVYDHALAHKWYRALQDLIVNGSHLEKNYCFLGFAQGERDGQFILDQVNQSIAHINGAGLGYQIDDWFTMDNTMTDEPINGRTVGRNIQQHRLNQLHRYFEDLQGVSGQPSPYYVRSDADTRWHIRQLNLLCHEFESWALSWRKLIEAPDWCRPSMLMCWLNAPRFGLEPEDYEYFGIETINRDFGGVYVGVNKAVGKHHWEVFTDEGRDSRLEELTTSTMRSQTEAAGDFDIEWGRNPAAFPWQKKLLSDFRHWLLDNGFDPNDKSLTIGHPKVAQVNIYQSFGTNDIDSIWTMLTKHQDVCSIKIGNYKATYDYHWSDEDFRARQVKIIQGEYHV